MKKLIKITLTLFITLIIVLGFALPLNPVGNWYQQFMPNLNGANITDIIFTDSLNGYAVSSLRTGGDSSYIFKTTNGGDNWNIKFMHNKAFVKVKFVNATTGFTNAFTRIYKTTNAGENWTAINLPSIFGDDMFVLNQDTIWLAMSESSTGGVWRTTNGGVNWTQQINLGIQNPNKIYMYNSRIGFIAEDFNYLRKTTNSGVNWSVVPSVDGFLDMHFVDTLTGWKCYSFMKKTTDGGNSWVTQTLPGGGQLLSSGMSKFSVLNRDTIWGVGGQIQAGASTIRGIIFRTTNGGNNWLFQVPDTGYGNFNYYSIQFTDKLHGWAYTTVKGIHTTTGGDSVWITGITQISNNIPKDFMLFQIYPNPFNPYTTIKVDVSKSMPVTLYISDVLGRMKYEIINEQLSPGTYTFNWDSGNYSSGVYFYTLLAGSIRLTRKMLLIK